MSPVLDARAGSIRSSKAGTARIGSCYSVHSPCLERLFGEDVVATRKSKQQQQAAAGLWCFISAKPQFQDSAASSVLSPSLLVYSADGLDADVQAGPRAPAWAVVLFLFRLDQRGESLASSIFGPLF